MQEIKYYQPDKEWLLALCFVCHIQKNFTQNEKLIMSKNKRFSEDEILNLVIGYYESGKSKNTFSKLSGIRPHYSINLFTPNQAHQMTGFIPSLWKKKSSHNDIA